MKILVTGVNGDIGEAIGRILKEEFSGADISGADAAGLWPGGFVYPNMINVPLASSPEYLESMQHLAEQFDLIIPTSEPELGRLAQIENIMSRLPLLMVDPEILKTFMDKYTAFHFFKKHNIKTPETKLFADVKVADLPIYIKPRKGAGSRGHLLVKTDLELQAARLIAAKDWIAQEYLLGDDNEYTCAFCRFDDKMRHIVFKRQLQGDKTVKAEVVNNQEINILLEKISQLLTINGSINIQLKMTNRGPIVFEINPRLSSTVMMRHRLGFKDCTWWVKNFFKMPIEDYCAPENGTVVYRMSTECVVPRVTKKTSFSIGKKTIGPGHPVFIIAEIGINHGGDPQMCAHMIEAAAASGADAVKLQTVNADASYLKGTASYTEFKDKELSDEALKELMQLADRLGIVFFSTPGDFESLDRIIRLGIPAIKISSGLMTNLPLVTRAAATGLPLIISTGMAYEREIVTVLNYACKGGASGLALLKCTAIYPAPDEAINLAAIPTMIDRYKVPIGYSDHTIDDLACIGAVTLGATIIEKHFTLDSKLPGADHHISMEPQEFSRMIYKIRRLSLMRGLNSICATKAEIAMRAQRHRCLVAKVDISPGDIFSEMNVALMRPLPGKTGLSAAMYENVLGRKAITLIHQNEPINEHHLGDKQ